MRGKASSQNLLRALDGEDLHLGEELNDLILLGERVRCAVPKVPPLQESERRRIWNDTVSGARQPAALRGRAGRVPRLAWGIAAGLALATVAALVLVFVNIAGEPVVESVDIARLGSLRGEMRIIDSQGVERVAGEGDVIREGDSLIAARDARGVVEFDDGSIMRLDGETEVTLLSGEDGIDVDIARGKSYHRVLGDSPYVISSGEVRVRAVGTAFSFDVDEGTQKVVSLQSSVEVDVYSHRVPDWNSNLREGEIFLYREDEMEPLISEVSRDDLESEWLIWNGDRDRELGLPLGVLSLLYEEPIADNQTTPQPEPSQTPADDDGQTPQPAPTPEPSPTPTPAPQPVEESVVLSAQAGEGVVSFSWSVTGYSGFQGFKLCRSETNTAPSYPNDWWKYIDGENARSTSDNTVQAGHTYYYRLGVYNQGTVIAYSNAVQVTVPGQPQDLSITLSATVEGGKVKLSWQVSGQGSYDGFKVCRSESNPKPAYPADALTFISCGQSSYADGDVLSGHTYYYRVGIYKGGDILAYSNAVKVTLP
jgi:hypothetical protein